MASPRRPISKPLALALGSLLLAGCELPFMTSGLPAGTLIGAVEWGGNPAPGKSVHLLKRSEDGTYIAYRRSGALVAATTNDAGIYTFQDVEAGTYLVQYLSVPVLDAQGSRIGPNEVASWRSRAVVLSGSGGRVSPFELTYNGLIYPESGRNYHVSQTAPLPFHWSTHLRASRYRIVLYHPSTGGQPSNKVLWRSEWTSNPSALFQQKVTPGNYSWEVEIDSSAGIGFSVRRTLDLSTPLPQEPEEPEDPIGEDPIGDEP